MAQYLSVESIVIQWELQDSALKNALVIVTLTLLVSACANFAPRTTPASDRQPPQTADAQAMSNAAIEESAIDARLPSVPLTKELLFQLLSSEIAQQRGDWQSAYITLLGIAQQTRDPRIARRTVEIAMGAKQHDKTLTAIRLWHELAPTSEEATQYYLGLIVTGDDLTEAQSILEERLKEIRPQVRPLLMFQIQRLLARAKDKAAAFAMLERLLKPYESTPETHLVLAEGALANGDHVRAMKEARIALTAKPDSELAALTLAQVTSDKAEAEKGLVDFLSAYPKAHDVRVAYARMLVGRSQYDQAQKQFELVLKGKPQDLTSLYALGILNHQNKNPAAAEKYLTNYLDALAQQPNEKRDTSAALMTLAQIAEDRNDMDGALKWLELIESGEAYFGAQVKQAQLTAKKGDIRAARRLLAEIETDSQREQVHIITAEAQILREANQVPEAFAVYQAGMKRFPKNTDLMYDYAMLAEKNDKLDVMETMLRKVIELAPDNQHAYNALGYSLAERNIRLPEAFKLIEKALELAPDDPFIMDSMGWVHFRLGNLKEAENMLRRAYALRPDPEIAVHLGEVLWVKGAKEDAQKLWRDAKAKDPKNDTLKSTLARFQVKL